MMTLSGFYAVIDRDDPELAREVLAAGACALQLRMKDASADALMSAARKLRAIVRHVPFVINDRVDIALAVGADAVHLGQTDIPLADARRIAGSRLAIGVSTHDLAQVHSAIADGADYLGYGPVFETRTKRNPDATQGLEALRLAVQAAGAIPVVAIGGITEQTAESVYLTGAACVCAIGAVLGSSDVGKAARLLGR